ncbi:resistin-like gamma isoform X1 [Erpetoichthys calabaricus]|uniref:resistin-like gamma isoform X1 n=1 Tax=Erpetoichthys calabaricus TaxID=27687 RepID=UPI002234CD31|nr:resistin-like gamma isoform X1 [Erpetoichthys calabaricus]
MKMIACLLALTLVCLDETGAHGHRDKYMPFLMQYVNRGTLSCTSVQTQGSFATCPTGYSPTGCACGYGCGSWDIQNEMTCHCQCANMDWTTARCCKLNFY